MKVFPKIPRYDHPVVSPDLNEADDLVLLEKYDGSSFRFTLYDERYARSYPEPVAEAAGGDGALVFGTRRTIRGSHLDALDDIDGALHRAIRCLRDGIDAEAFRAVNDAHGSPVIVYAENLVYSTLDYGFTERALPALVGFDVLPYDRIESMTPPGNPYEESFDGFLDLEETHEVFDRIRQSGASTDRTFIPATILDRPGGGFDPAAYDVPRSSLSGDVRAEGIVLRSDRLGARAKVVRDEFEELHREQFGTAPSDAESGAEYVVARYCTAGRIRKIVREMVVEEGREFGPHLNDDLYPRVVEDVWAEHWRDLMELDVTFRPADIHPLVAKRCIAELRSMETNAELNDASPVSIWRHLS